MIPQRKVRTLAVGGFTRPANTTAYDIGDLVANSAGAAGTVVPVKLDKAAGIMAGAGVIRRLRVTKSSTVTANASFRVHLFRKAPVVSASDNAALAVTNALDAGYMGYFDVSTGLAIGQGATGVAAPATGAEVMFEADADSRAIYALIEARAAYLPASGEVFGVVAEVTRD